MQPKAVLDQGGFRVLGAESAKTRKIWKTGVDRSRQSH
jgi:ketopantoate hydroxymethyltransferase